MSLHEYRDSIQLTDQHHTFYGLIMAAMIKADTHNAELLGVAFPEVREELEARYHAPNGYLDGEGTDEHN